MKEIDALFDRLDDWRQLPSYQLERRADIFFSFYLLEALHTKLGITMCPQLVPEFPVSRKVINGDDSKGPPYHIDYFALSRDGNVTQPVFVELKTDTGSLRPEQNDYLIKARNAGLENLLVGLRNIFPHTKQKEKYRCLYERLEEMKLIDNVRPLLEIMKHPNHQGANDAAKQINVVPCPQKPLIVYVMPDDGEKPEGDGIEIILFTEFAKVVKRHGNDLSKRFVKSIEKWANAQTEKQDESE